MNTFRSLFPSKRKQMLAAVLALVTAVVLVVGFDFNPVGQVTTPTPQENSNQTATTTATVTRVVDGDTFDVSVNGQADTVRMLGIDTPEITWPSEENNLSQPESECYGQAARKFLQDQIKGRQVQLVADARTPARDTYGRRLAYVYESGALINELMLTEGYAKELTVDNGYDKRDTFRAAASSARAQNRGLWSDICQP